MTAWSDARAAAHRIGSRMFGRETSPLADASGRTLAADLIALTPLPGYSSSAMDGWAVSGNGPWRVGSPIVAGDRPDSPALRDGSARPIMTGAPIPPHTLGVLRLELGKVADGLLVATESPRPGAHVRRTGEESHAGDVLLKSGSVLTPPRIALAAVAGHDELTVARRPRAAGVFLGAEVVAAGVPDPGLVRDAYAPQFPAFLTALGLETVGFERIADSLEETVEAINRADADIVITTGGTAKGATDHVRAALARLGARIVLESIAMRPGHPLLIARLPDERIVICLPGNPLAAMVALVSIGAPLIDGALGRPLPRLGSAWLAQDIPPGRGGTRLVPAQLDDDRATPTGRQGSGMLGGLAAADTLLVIGERGAAAGDRVPVVPLPW